MKISGGKYKGRNIAVNNVNPILQPTKSIVREAIFNILIHNISTDGITDKTFLDICAGTGVMGFEAISRGMKKAIFIDNSKESWHDILLTKENFKLDAEVEFLFYNVLNMPYGNNQADIVFMDPPYNSMLHEKILPQLIEKEWIHKNSIIILETDKSCELHNVPEEFTLISERLYGRSRVSFFTMHSDYVKF